MNNKTYDILIIDDEELIIESISKICKLENLTVDQVLEAEEAIPKLESNSYSLIICDIMMPGMDGFAFLEYLSDKLIPIPVIITTGYSTVENAVKALKEGAIGFIPKPFTVDEMLSVIKRGMNFSKMMSANNNPCSQIIIASPPKYFRLGYSVWANLGKEGTVLIGLTSLFIETIETPTEILYEEIGSDISQGKPILTIKTEDFCEHQIFSPVSGKIIDFNKEVIANINLIQKDPYFQGWIYRIIPSMWDIEQKNLTPCSSDRF